MSWPFLRLASLGCCCLFAGLPCLAGCKSEPSRAASELGAELEPIDEAFAPKVGTPPAQALEQLAKHYARGYEPDAPAISGELAAGERRDFLSVMRYGHCYRVLGAGGAGLDDLDLVLFDPSGVRVTQDPGQDPFPVLGLQRAICPGEAGAFRIQAQAYKGQGAFAMRVYRTSQ